jgi:RNA polymerase primary sigma factor
VAPATQERSVVSTPDCIRLLEPACNQADGEHTRTTRTGAHILSALDIYMQEMGRYPLLDEKEEMELASQYSRGRKASAQLANASDLDEQERRRLEKAVAQGERACKQIIRGNLRLVITTAKQYTGSGLPFDDLIQEGNVGLIKAVERFDHARGNRFSTYAVWWIKQAIYRAITNKGRTVRLPAHIAGKLRALRRAGGTLESRLSRRPTAHELAEEMGVRVLTIRRLQRWQRRVLSLNMPVGEEGDSELADIVQDRQAPSLEEMVHNQQLREQVRNLVTARLSPREQRVLSLRFGLGGGKRHTLEEIAEGMGVTRERVRQIERRAIRRLRHAGIRSRGLRGAWT